MKEHNLQIFLWKIFIPRKYKNYNQYLKDGMSYEFAYRRAKNPPVTLYKIVNEELLDDEKFDQLKDLIIESKNVESKNYFISELKLRDCEMDKIYDLYCKHRNVKGGLCPTASFTIEYQYSSIGVGRYLTIEGQRFPLNDDIDF